RTATRPELRRGGNRQSEEIGVCIALSYFCYRRRKTHARQGPRKLPKLDVAGSTPVARSSDIHPSVHPSTAKRRHSSGTPWRVCVPRSAKRRPAPATRSFTVLETSTPEGPAKAEAKLVVGPVAGDELLRPLQAGVGVAGPGEVVDAGKFDVLCPGDVLRHVAGAFDGSRLVPSAMDDERRHPDRGQDVPHVGVDDRPQQEARASRADR